LDPLNFGGWPFQMLDHSLKVFLLFSILAAIIFCRANPSFFERLKNEK
jgi:hypothetical protein